MAAGGPAVTTASYADAALDSAGLPRPYTVSPVSQGASNAVLRADDARGRAWAVRVTQHTPGRFDVERVAMERACAAGVPVAPVLFAGEVTVDGSTETAMVSEWVEGRRLADLARSEIGAELVDDIATVLSRVHSIAVDGFGNLDVGLTGPWPTFSGWFVDGGLVSVAASRDVAERLGAAAAASTLTRAAEALEAARQTLDAASSRLIHGDFSPANLLVRGDAVVALLDWESVKGGPVGLDFGWWDFIGGGDLIATERLVDAYATRIDHDLDLDAVTDLRRLVQIRILASHLAWADQADADIDTDRVIERLRALLATE